MPAVVTRAHIRKWIHERDLGKLEKLVWEGQGERLLPETSASPRVRRFLEAVPFILSIIKEVHSAAVTNNLSLWRMRTSPPVPTHLLVSKDKNGLTPLHKAAGLGHVDIVDEILQRSPKAATMKDIDNRSPLHYAAASRHQSASDVYRKLVEAGIDEKQPDKKGKSASYYAEHPTELDTSSLLTVTPEAPRAPTKLPSQWNWGMLAMGVDTMLTKTMAVLPSIKPNRAAVALKPRPSNSHPNLSKIQADPPLSTSNSHPDLSNSLRKTNNNKAQQKEKSNSENTRNKQVNKNLEKSQKLAQSNLPEIPRTNALNNPSTQQKSMNSQDKHDLNQETNTQNPNKSSTNVKVATNVPPKPNTAKQLSSTFPVGKIQPVAADPRRGVTQHTVATPATTFSFSPGALYHPPQTAPTRSEVSHFPGVPPGTAPSVLRAKEAHGEAAPVRPISPPGSRMPAPVLERWIRACDLGRLEDALLEGRGPRLLKLIASSAREPPIRTFVDRAPIFLEGMQRMHDAAIEGDEPTVRFLIDRYRRLVLARDEEGMQPMHVAARAGHEHILRVLLAVFPRGVAITDWEGRTPLHHAGMCPDLNKALTCYQLLLDHRAPEAAKDAIGNRASDYLSETRIQNPSVPDEQRLDTPASIADSQTSAYRTIAQSPATNPGTRVGTAPIMPETPAAASSRIGTAPSSSETPAAANMTPDIIPQRDEISRLPTAPLTTESALPATQSSDEEFPDTPTSDNPPEYNSGTPDIPKENLVPPYSSPDFSANTPVVQSNKISTEVTPNNVEKSHDPIREEARRLVEARDTEKLAELVLSGHGEKLKGLTSSNPYVQGLLDNVPVYMDKIAAVHEAAARGDVAALQVALERRKFVTSRDKYGATPLHKAVLFLQVGVARYLGTRFPEALDAQDHAGRTSLHYAAVLPDRGALYRSLVALGADPRLRDKVSHVLSCMFLQPFYLFAWLQRGHTALDYQLHHEQRRNHEQLLNELGADPALAGHALDPARAAAAAAAAAVSLDMLQMPQPDPPKSRADGENVVPPPVPCLGT
ncbi:hypothetical protein B566_EDAN011266 [Ephemera danica]|nr:hypothetical protein B566_EDAN011266 [Ephemera danica]